MSTVHSENSTATRKVNRIPVKKKNDDSLPFFPIGDLHIRTLDESQVFADYLNQRPEKLIILLGDVPHFANSLWNNNVMDHGKGALIRGLEEDVAIWEDFLSRLRVDTIYYLGTHETFAIPIILKELPSRKLRIIGEHVSIPQDLQIMRLNQSESHPLYVTGLNIPGNVQPINSLEFASKKMKTEKYITDHAEHVSIPNPSQTVFCTHDPCDVQYHSMGYRALTTMLEKWPFKAHYYAHIHSSIRDVVVNETKTINRSFVALGKLNKEALEPATNEIRSIVKRQS